MNTSGTPPTIAVIILNYNGGDMLLNCVRSVAEGQEAETGIIVVDNASMDGSAQKAKAQFPDITLIQNTENLLFCKGCNVGIRHALDKGYDYIFLLNNDATLLPDSLSRLVEHMENNRRLGGVQPLLLFEHDPGIIQSAGCRISLSGLAWDHLCGQPVEEAGEQPLDVPGITGGAMFLRALAIREVGMFAEEFEMYFEDVDLSLRLRSAGWELACLPKARACHIRSATTDALGTARRVFYCQRNSCSLIFRHFPIPAAALVLLIKTPLTLGAAVMNGIRGNKETGRAILRGFLSGLSFSYKRAPVSRAYATLRLIDRRLLPPR